MENVKQGGEVSIGELSSSHKHPKGEHYGGHSDEEGRLCHFPWVWAMRFWHSLAHANNTDLLRTSHPRTSLCSPHVILTLGDLRQRCQKCTELERAQQLGAALLLCRTWMCFPAPMWKFITICTFSPQRPDTWHSLLAFVGTKHTHGIHVYMQAKYSYT